MATSSVEQVTYNSPDGATMGKSTTEKISFFGTTPITQRAAAAQATSIWGTSATTSVDTARTAVITEIVNTLTALGLWKGAA
jgi:hypothetical protein